MLATLSGPPQVLGVSDSFQVGHVDAVSHRAQMVAFQPGRDGPPRALIGVSVCKDGAPGVAQSKSAVALRAYGASPQLTAAGIDCDLGIKSLVLGQRPQSAPADIRLKGAFGPNDGFGRFGMGARRTASVMAGDKAHGLSFGPSPTPTSHPSERSRLTAAALAQSVGVGEQAQADGLLAIRTNSASPSEMVVRQVTGPLVGARYHSATSTFALSHGGIIA